jgi:exosortase A-associated hydrolase 1
MEPMNPVEHALTFRCRDETLVGILAKGKPGTPIGVLIIVGGPQYRVGSHRQFVLLARGLAAEGIPTMRFDYRGMGDATGEMRSFEGASDDIAAAIAVMKLQCPGITRIVLWGLCDAASAALIYWHAERDARLAGIVLVNPWVRSQAVLARTRVKHYYAQRLLEKDFWRKLFRGEVNMARSVGSFSGNVILAAKKGKSDSGPASSFRDRMADGLRSFPGPVLLITSGRDLTAKEFLENAGNDPRWAGLLERADLIRYDLNEADHTFSSAPWTREVEAKTLSWLRRSFPGC